MSKNVCVSCSVFMRPRKNAVAVLETTEDIGPYRIYEADLWECPRCSYQVITGFGLGPVAEHYQESFGTILQMYADKKVLFEVEGKLHALP